MSSPDHNPLSRTAIIRAVKLAVIEIAEGNTWGATVTLMDLQTALCEDFAMDERRLLVEEQGAHVARQ